MLNAEKHTPMNVSKLHREDLLNKIQQIRTYIASAPQDQNTGNLLQYLDELVKDVKGIFYGTYRQKNKSKNTQILAQTEFSKKNI